MGSFLGGNGAIGRGAAEAPGGQVADEQGAGQIGLSHQQVPQVERRREVDQVRKRVVLSPKDAGQAGERPTYLGDRDPLPLISQLCSGPRGRVRRHAVHEARPSVTSPTMRSYPILQACQRISAGVLVRVADDDQ